jgi:hypothetical protein
MTRIKTITMLARIPPKNAAIMPVLLATRGVSRSDSGPARIPLCPCYFLTTEARGHQHRTRDFGRPLSELYRNPVLPPIGVLLGGVDFNRMRREEPPPPPPAAPSTTERLLREIRGLLRAGR